MQEFQHTEFKRHWKDDLLKWISAFANEGLSEERNVGVSDGVNDAPKTGYFTTENSTC